MNNKDQINITVNLELSEQGKRLLDALRPKGEWTNAAIMTVCCSNCKAEFHELEAMNFCPNCGADMRDSL